VAEVIRPKPAVSSTTLTHFQRRSGTFRLRPVEPAPRTLFRRRIRSARPIPAPP
jgi:hypothetical protein